MHAHQTPQKVLVHLDSRTVVMEVDIRQGVCYNSPAEWTSPENGWRSSGLPILGLQGVVRCRVGGRGGCFEACWRQGVEQRLVQILVVVANIQMGTLKTEVEKGSLGTLFGQGLVEPKRREKSLEGQ